MASPGKPGCVTGAPTPDHADDPRIHSESVCSDAPLAEKCSRSASPISLVSDRNPIHCNNGTQPTRTLTQRAPASVRPPSPIPPRPPAVDHARPAAQRAVAREQPGTARERQSRAARDRPAGSGGLPPTRKGGRRGRPSGSAPLVCGAVPVEEARGASASWKRAAPSHPADDDRRRSA